MVDHKGTPQIEYGGITMKTKLFNTLEELLER